MDRLSHPVQTEEKDHKSVFLLPDHVSSKQELQWPYLGRSCNSSVTPHGDDFETLGS